jgi:hypothetical protein
MRALSAFVGLLFLALGAARCTSNGTPTDAQPQGGSDTVRVYYGPNESHSRDWAQVGDEGLVGVVYFQHSSSGGAEGTLRYETIRSDGSKEEESVTTGTRLEKAVLLFDSSFQPHIFVANSSASDQTIDHYFRGGDHQWRSETIIHFLGEGGKAIYELSGATGPDHSFHLLVLKTRVEVDSEDIDLAWTDSRLFHLTNASGQWVKELIQSYDMAYTYDFYIKSSIRQDIAVDDLGHVHVVFGEQIRGSTDPSRLRYATNETGSWRVETALNYQAGTVDDAGWFPSLALDSHGVPHIACVYVSRVPTHSATSATLLFLTRRGSGDWQSEVVADTDDGYFGGDGRRYTGGLAHLVFDSHDTPHVAFSDIASTHWPGTQRVTTGNVRYGVRRGGIWSFSTIYRQPSPTSFFSGREMHGLCLLLLEGAGTVRIVGQELLVTSPSQYSSHLLDFSWQEEFSG